MLMDRLVEILEANGNFTTNGVCLDCKKAISIDVSRTENSEIKIEGGAIYQPDKHMNYDEKYVYKCDNCYNKDKKIYGLTEIYTRCVGYYRPTKQFNPGKVAEFAMRKDYELETSQQISQA